MLFRSQTPSLLRRFSTGKCASGVPGFPVAAIPVPLFRWGEQFYFAEALGAAAFWEAACFATVIASVFISPTLTLQLYSALDYKWLLSLDGTSQCSPVAIAVLCTRRNEKDTSFSR